MHTWRSYKCGNRRCRQGGACCYFGGLPVPVSVIVCGDPVTLSKIISVPLCGVVFGGVNVTSTLQLLPGASVLWHCDLTANGGVAVSIWIIAERCELLLLAFLSEIFLGLLVFPTTVPVPNDTLDG